MANIWICSDWHLNHNQPFIWEKRGFTSVEEMNNAIIKCHNALVAPDDEVYMLGDATLGDLDAGYNLMTQMNGHIHIAIGNHETDNRIEMYRHLPNVVEIAYAYRIKLGKWHFYATHYPTLTGNWDDGKTPGQSVINLCGHTHTFDPFTDWDKGKIFHCEMETNSCRPWRLENIQKLIKERYFGE